MNELIMAGIAGSIIGFCISKIQFHTEGYWYSLTFFDKTELKNVIAQFENKVMRVSNIAAARNEAKASPESVIVSIDYLGQDSILNFTSNMEELYKEVDKKERDEK